MLTRLVAGFVAAWALVATGEICAGADHQVVPGAKHVPSTAAAEASSEPGEGAKDGSAQGEHAGGINPLAFKTDLAVWTALVFLLLLAILWKFAWGPLAEGLDRREQNIQDQIAQADRTHEQAKELLAQYQQKLAASEEEVRAILEQGRRDADQLGREMIEKTREETRAEKQRALEQIDAAATDAMKELARQGANLAVELAGKIVRAELKPEHHARLIEQTLAAFTGRKPNANGR